jgi:exonuclease III
MDMRFSTWNVRSLYRAGSLTAAAARGLARYKLDLMGMQDVRWDREGTVRAGNYKGFLCRKEVKIMNCGQDVVYTTQ